MARSAAEVTALLRAWHGGNEQDFGKLMPLVYEALRMLAQRLRAKAWLFRELNSEKPRA